jgi:hypothetical protein
VGRACGTHGRGEKVYRVLVGKPEGKRPLGRSRRRRRVGSKWTLGRLAGGGVEWIHLAQFRDRWQCFVNMVMNLRVFAPRSLLVRLFVS